MEERDPDIMEAFASLRHAAATRGVEELLREELDVMQAAIGRIVAGVIELCERTEKRMASLESAQGEVFEEARARLAEPDARAGKHDDSTNP